MRSLKIVAAVLFAFAAIIYSCSEEHAQPERSMEMDVNPMGETVHFHDSSEYLEKLKVAIRNSGDSMLTSLPPEFLEGAVIKFHKEKLDPRINYPVEVRPFGQ